LRVPSSCFYLPQGEAPKGARRLTEEIPCYAIAELSLEVQSRILSQQGVICDPLSMVVPHYFSDLKTGSFLDLCAAPGGKFLVAASRFPDLNCVAVEKSKRRFEFLKQRLEDFDGLKHRADLCHMDALDYLQDCKKTGRKFERILLDAPCSALGTVLNHPEYLCTKSDKKPKYLEELQQELLSKSLAVLSDDGELIYVVCTFSPEETELQIQKLCTSHAVESIPLKPLAGERHQQADHGRFLMAGDLGNQIFYVALLKRVPSNSGER